MVPLEPVQCTVIIDNLLSLSKSGIIVPLSSCCFLLKLLFLNNGSFDSGIVFGYLKFSSSAVCKVLWSMVLSL